jgi:hypothetical protein
VTAFPKPKDTKRQPVDAVAVRPDGREVCDLNTSAGRLAYKRKVRDMADRQSGICCLFGHSPVCHPRGLLLGYTVTFEHEQGRGGGKRDDRIEKPDPENPGKVIRINGAAHMTCNSWKGSRFIDYNRGFRNV